MKKYNRRKEQMVEVSEPFMNELFSIAVWSCKKHKRNGFIARLDYVESILRRGAEGIRFEEIWLR